MIRNLFLAVILLSTFQLTAQVRLARIFGDHMVIQRAKPIQVWGWSGAGEKISVRLAGNARQVKANNRGEWVAELPQLMAGGPYDLVVKGKDSISIKDIMIGDVWLCSGQSNMEWTVSNSGQAEVEIRNAAYPMIRHFKVPHKTSLTPEKELPGGAWELCNPATAANFTAVGYSYARELFTQLKVPIGLINSSWGGTNVETWISSQSFFESQEFASLKNKMPPNQDTIISRRKARMAQVINMAQLSLPAREDVSSFSKQAFNDGNWKTMKLPVLWENSGLPGVDGTVWFRKTFAVPADMNLSEMILQLGPIDDQDSTFVNGILVGTNSVWNEDREYKVPAGIVKTTGNSIAIKVKDFGGGGGIYGEPENMQLTIGTHKMSLAGDWKFQVEEVLGDSNFDDPNAYPTLLYNAMINPLIRYPIQGVIWYQGESNAERAVQYKTSFPMMINDWRKHWKADFPFLYVQLTSYEANGGTSQNGGSEWAELREAQESALQLSHTGMAVIIDIGESKDIHPKNKQDVGKRLAAIALSNVYGLHRTFSGPRYRSMETRSNQVLISFTNADNGLEVKNRYGYINGFEIAGADQKFYYARAFAEGGKIVVFSELVPKPVAVRYAWADDPNDVNLFNKEGFPAAPFRTDNWPTKTEKNKYWIE
jgi:sialate O-acetylesterase